MPPLHSRITGLKGASLGRIRTEIHPQPACFCTSSTLVGLVCFGSALLRIGSDLAAARLFSDETHHVQRTWPATACRVPKNASVLFSGFLESGQPLLSTRWASTRGPFTLANYWAIYMGLFPVVCMEDIKPFVICFLSRVCKELAKSLQRLRRPCWAWGPE